MRGFKQPPRRCGSAQNIENNPMQSSPQSPARMGFAPTYLTRRANHRHSFVIAQSVKRAARPAMASSSVMRDVLEQRLGLTTASGVASSSLQAEACDLATAGQQRAPRPRCHAPLQAGHPVRGGLSIRSSPSRRTGSPAFADDDSQKYGARDVFTALSPETNSSCLRRPRICLACARLGRPKLGRLDASNGCQDHTLLPYAAAPFVSRSDRSRGSPALRSVRTPDAAASTASRPAFVTIAIRPSRWDETA